MPVPEQEETKKPAKKKKVAEVDPEVLAAELAAKALAEDIEKYGVSGLNLCNGFFIAHLDLGRFLGRVLRRAQAMLARGRAWPT